jgi:hypothetical protein
LRYPGEPGLDELEAVKEPQDIRKRPHVQLRRRLTVDALRLAALARRVFLQGAVGDGQVAAGHQVIAVLRHDLVRVCFVRNEMQGARAQHRYRLSQVEQPGDLGVPQDAGRVAQVTLHHRDLAADGQQSLAV